MMAARQLRAVLYGRLTQDAKTTEKATERCRCYAFALGWQVVGRYVDYPPGRAKNPNQPGFWEAVDDFRNGRADVLIAQSIDTISIDPDQILALLTEAAGNRWFIVALDERLDTTTLSGQTAEFVLRNLLLTARRNRLKDEGRLARKQAPADAYSEANAVGRIRALRQDGWHWPEIAAKMAEEGFEPPEYRGKRVWKPIVAHWLHESARAAGLFDEVTLEPRDGTSESEG